MQKRKIHIKDPAKRISWRRNNFESGVIKECYVIYNGKAIKITKENARKELIINELKKLGL